MADPAADPGTAPRFDLLTLGEPLIEFNADARDDRCLRGFGGDVSNVAVAAARLGARVGCLGALGADAFGDDIMALWAREGVDAACVRRDPEAPTGAYLVEHGGADGHRFAYLRAGSAATRYRLDDAARAALASTRILHLSAISQGISLQACDTGFEAMALAREAGARISYDTNLRLALWPLPRARAIIRESLRLCDVALPGHDDAAKIFGTQDPDALVDHCLAGGCGIVAMTLGAQGAIVATPDERRRIPALPVEARDATGAGDAFDAAFLVALQETGDPFIAGQHACVAAALSTTGFGAIAPLPDRAAVAAALAQADRPG
ncbi:MAG: sugar kinase [Salinarimonas sp.]|nr:sugar kinase [Salinarimonas sp.]